jgi:hypothetical protein
MHPVIIVVTDDFMVVFVHTIKAEPVKEASHLIHSALDDERRIDNMPIVVIPTDFLKILEDLPNGFLCIIEWIRLQTTHKVILIGAVVRLLWRTIKWQLKEKLHTFLQMRISEKVGSEASFRCIYLL